MRQIRQVLRLKYDKGLSHRAIAEACSMGTGTVSDYVGRARRAGLSWPLPEGLDDGSLEAKLFPPPPPAGRRRPLPDYGWVHRELRKIGVTLQLLWHEYMEMHPDGLRYTQFCTRYRDWQRKLNPSMRQVHRAGEKLFVDFSGKRPTVVDRRTGEVREVELFVGVLGASNYTYAEAVASQKLPDWIGAHVRTMEYFGGSAEIWVSDGLKSGVTKPCKYDPEINRSYADCAEHYGAVVIAARPYRAKDKAKVESGVLVAQRWILAALRNRTFFSILQLNEAIWELLEVLNGRRMQKVEASRRDLFETIDRPALLPLPAARYELTRWKRCRVNIDYHVQVESNYYSVPYQLVGEQVEARYTDNTVEMLFKDKRVASHRRLAGKGKHATRPEHMPAAHRAHAEWSPSRLVGWASKTGPATGRMVDKILETFKHPEQGYRSCLGLIRLSDGYGAERVEAACRRAEHLGSYRYRTVKNILVNGMDEQPLDEQLSLSSTVPVHDNIRGADYYGEEPSC